MAFLLINSAITDQFIGALCNTLVHSLWQGLLLAAVTGFIIIFTRKSSSSRRYNLLLASLVLFAVGVSITFALQFKQAQAVAVTSVQNSPVIQVNAIAPSFTNTINTPVQTTGFTTQLFGYLNAHHNAIVLVWFLIICVKSIQLIIGLLSVHRLKSTNTVPANIFWKTRMLQLADNLNINEAIDLLESGLAKVPMVIGTLKPVILMPIGLLTALSTEDVEAILVHELAHIKRRDYLVNLLQSLMEIIFFFNPAVLWISQLIKAERENCCDDLALAQSSNKVNYIRALVSCEEYQQAVPAYAMGFPGGKGSLLDRVKRMASNRNHSLNLFEKTVLAICLVASGLCMSAFAEKENIKRTVHNLVKAIQHTQVNDVQKQALLKSTSALNKQTEKIKENTALVKNTPQLPVVDTVPDKADQRVYTLPVAESVQPLQSLQPLATTSFHLDPLNFRLCDPNGKPITMASLSPALKTNVTTNLSANINASVTLRPDTDIKQSMTMNYTGKDGKKYNHNINYSFTYNTDTSKKSIYNKYPVESRHSVTYSKNSKFTKNFDSLSKSTYSINYAYKTDSNYKKTYSTNYNRNYKLNYDSTKYKTHTIYAHVQVSAFGEELLKAHLIKDKEKVTAELDNDKLIINGVKQSEESHQLILKKYVKSPGDKVHLSYSSAGK